MENNLNYIMFFRDFAENILLNLNCDYSNYLTFSKKSSKLKRILYDTRLDSVISNIAYGLIEKGYQRVYIYKSKDKVYLSISKYKEEKELGKFTLFLPMKIMNPIKRILILKELKRMNYLTADEYNDSEYPRDSLYIMELIRKKASKITKDYTSTNSMDKATDHYILYREIRKRIKQTLLVNYILEKINKSIHKYINDIETDDYIIFNCLTIEKLQELESNLLNNKTTIKEINEILWRKYKSK